MSRPTTMSRNGWRVGEGPRSRIQAWLQASRLPTLWAAVAPVAVGTACAYSAGCFRLLPAITALLGALSIQLGTNYSNDLFDFRKGADRDDRLGPTRAVSAGWIRERQMIVATIIAFALATLCGVYLASVAGWPIVVLGIASILAGVAYTAGPFPLAYLGLGEVFVMAFFGFGAVTGTAFVQCRNVPESAWLSAVAVGALATAILVVNNLRDRKGDGRAGKRTLIVRWGADFGRAEFVALLALPYVVLIVLTWRGRPEALLAFASFPLAWRAIRRGVALDGAELNPVLGETARLQIVFSLLLALGLVLELGA